MAGRKTQADEQKDDLVDEAGRESFPASDPPSWTLGQDREHGSGQAYKPDTTKSAVASKDPGGRWGSPSGARS